MQLFDDKFNERLLICRSKIGLTQSELAALIGVAQRMIAAYELGESRPRVRVLMKLSEVLGVSPEWLASGKESSNPREGVMNTEFRRLPILKPGFIHKYITNKLDPIYIKKYVTFGFDVGISAFAVQIDDDSMTSTDANDFSFPRGSIVVIDPSISVRGGDYVFLLIPENPSYFTLRKFYPSVESIKFSPLNKNYPTESFNREVLKSQHAAILPAVGVVSTLPAFSRLKSKTDILDGIKNSNNQK
ncbi:LexA family transcriptional regulator [Klebsiella oxytoca]|uniref:LexA family transcriptional regulator n=1 Tax=Klebsiella oxytoca TaxID=571 RepID=UPI002DB94B6F|nr:LexA family transcriptional regulator [Klebsiella oxytoca]MEB7878599.1 LexA family transcriptional regulator [Klebsiella oxytoca]